ncbi:MAG: gliding motility-associated-like protein [Bacteroidia bacterium]
MPEIKCSDSIIDIINTSSYGDAYFWTVSKQNNIVHNTNDKNPTIKFLNSGVYTIKLVAKNAQCADSVGKDVEIGGVIALNAEFTVEVEDTCKGGVILIVNSSDKTADWYWNLGMGAGEQHNVTINRYTVDKPGHYTVTLRISDSSKCALDAIKIMEFDIHGADTQYAAFEHTFPDNCDPSVVVVTKTDDITSNWEWEIEEQREVFKNETSIELTDIPSGPLKVKLNYEDSELPCTVIEPLQKEIQVDSLDLSIGELLLYNVFTPNDDGINDCFRLDMKDAECYTVALFVYNRWGELLFRTENAVEECWDGKQKNGEYYPNGTYFGVVKLKHQEMEKIENISIAITFLRCL